MQIAARALFALGLVVTFTIPAAAQSPVAGFVVTGPLVQPGPGTWVVAAGAERRITPQVAIGGEVGFLTLGALFVTPFVTLHSIPPKPHRVSPFVRVGYSLTVANSEGSQGAMLGAGVAVFSREVVGVRVEYTYTAVGRENHTDRLQMVRFGVTFR